MFITCLGYFILLVKPRPCHNWLPDKPIPCHIEFKAVPVLYWNKSIKKKLTIIENYNEANYKKKKFVGNLPQTIGSWTTPILYLHTISVVIPITMITSFRILYIAIRSLSPSNLTAPSTSTDVTPASISSHRLKTGK